MKNYNHIHLFQLIKENIDFIRHDISDTSLRLRVKQGKSAKTIPVLTGGVISEATLERLELERVNQPNLIHIIALAIALNHRLKLSFIPEEQFERENAIPLPPLSEPESNEASQMLP